VTQKNRVFGTSLVGGYGVEIKIEADITVLVTYRRSQEKSPRHGPEIGCRGQKSLPRLRVFVRNYIFSSQNVMSPRSFIISRLWSGGLVLHHCLEVGKFHNSGLVVLTEVGKVCIATDDVVGTDGFSQREEVEVLRVADGCGRSLDADDGELAEGIYDGQQVVDVGLGDVLAYLVTGSHADDFLYEAGADIDVEAHVGKHPAHELRLMADEEGNPEVGVDDDLHTLLGVSYGSDLVHDFVFADGGIGGATANEPVEKLLACLGLPAELANELAEERPVDGRHVHVNALCCCCSCHDCIVFIFIGCKTAVN